MTADDESSDLSSLSSLSPAPSEDEPEMGASRTPKKPQGILKFFPNLRGPPPREVPSPPPRKRSPSPPHEYVLADNPDIAFIVMFRSRFNDVFPKSLAHFGPHELERDVVESIPGDRVEHFLCALLGLLLNRKQDVKQGHYGRALEDAITSHRSQWPTTWEDKSPLSGGATFNSMTPTERLTLLRNLILWAMASSDTVKSLINLSYKQNRHEDDLNQPRSVQPWGSDGEKRRYFLIEGQDDTHFRVYRESNPAGSQRTWWSVAGSVGDLRLLAERLETRDGGPKARSLSQKILQAIPRFEAGEEKRKRREYRQMRKEQFKRPESGFSIYEGRTRGKRMKYTYSDDEDIFSDSTGNRRSTRNTEASTPVETGPVTTSTGRQVRVPHRLALGAEERALGRAQDESGTSGRNTTTRTSGRPQRSVAVRQGANGWGSREAGSLETDEEDGSEAEFGDDEDDNADADAHIPEESEDDEEDDDDGGEEVEDDLDMDDVMLKEDAGNESMSLVVKLAVTPPKLKTVMIAGGEAAQVLSTPETQDGKGSVGAEPTPAASFVERPAEDSIRVAISPAAEARVSTPTHIGDEKKVNSASTERTNAAAYSGA